MISARNRNTLSMCWKLWESFSLFEKKDRLLREARDAQRQTMHSYFINWRLYTKSQLLTRLVNLHHDTRFTEVFEKDIHTQLLNLSDSSK